MIRLMIGQKKEGIADLMKAQEFGSKKASDLIQQYGYSSHTGTSF
jgi:hypothetical protein